MESRSQENRKQQAQQQRQQLQQQNVSCRLFGVMAREAPVCVVFRRGPSKWCQMVRWDTQTDYVERGQWFRGRVYERRCDLSPDGRLVVYFGMDARWDAETKGAWTAVSRVPYWTALALWPKGDCWDGGGLFMDTESLWVNCGEGKTAGPPLGGKPIGLRIQDKQPYMQMPSAECYGVYFPRLVRDGWEMGKFVMMDPRTTKVRWTKSRDGVTLVKNAIARVAEKAAEGKGTYYDEYEWVTRDGRVQAMAGVEWADWDQRGKMVFARDGKLWRGREKGGELIEEMVADLNGGLPKHEKSPEAAKSW